MLLSFRLNDNQVIDAELNTRFYDKVALKHAGHDEERFRYEGVRVVPPASCVAVHTSRGMRC